ECPVRASFGGRRMIASLYQTIGLITEPLLDLFVDRPATCKPAGAEQGNAGVARPVPGPVDQRGDTEDRPHAEHGEQANAPGSVGGRPIPPARSPPPPAWAGAGLVGPIGGCAARPACELAPTGPASIEWMRRTPRGSHPCREQRQGEQ